MNILDYVLLVLMLPAILFVSFVVVFLFGMFIVGMWCLTFSFLFKFISYLLPANTMLYKFANNLSRKLYNFAIDIEEAIWY